MPYLRVACICCCICLLACRMAQGQNWPSYRGKNASGVAEGAKAPTRWDAEKSLNVLWKFAVPGLGHSSPVVWGKRIFVTTAIGNEAKVESPSKLSADMTSAGDNASYTWRVYCLDKENGKVLWEQTAYKGVPRSKRHPLNSFATPTPATDGEHLVVFFGSEGLYCYKLDGTLLWKQDLGVLNAGYYADPQFQWGIGSSPIIYEGLVIIQCDIDKNPFIAAYDIKTGRRVWLTQRDDMPSWSTPSVFIGKNRAELIVNAPSHVCGYDLTTGKELWRLYWGMDIVESTPITSDEFIYVSSGKGRQNPIYAIRPTANGDITLKGGQSSNDFVAWSKTKGGPITTTPILYGSYLYALTDTGILRCYAATTGDLIYERRVGHEFLASPVASDGKLFLTSLDGDVYVVKAGPDFQLLAVNPMGEPCQATPAISDGVIFIRTHHHIFAIKDISGPQKTDTVRPSD